MKNFSLPLRFLTIHYNGSKYPGNTEYDSVKYGANCQSFVYEILRYFGIVLPDFRSSELWNDTHYTRKSKTLQCMDIAFFHTNTNPYGAHIGLCIGKNKILHLSRSVGYPAIWDIEEFKKYKQYQVYIGAKRLKKNTLI